MTAQEQYEHDEATNLEKVREYQRQGHSLQCAATMAWTGQSCGCEKENWRDDNAKRNTA